VNLFLPILFFYTIYNHWHCFEYRLFSVLFSSSFPTATRSLRNFSWILLVARAWLWW
jgi:hypothetical protein